MGVFKPSKQIGVGELVLGEEERRYLLEVIESNRLSYGEFCMRLESEFAALHGCRHAIFCSSGTSALHMALAALKEKYGWSDGDEVIVPAVTFIATSNAVLYNRLVPVFVDVDSRTYNIDPSLIESKITSRTRAILPVHLLGLPCDMGPIMDIASRYGLRVIEDSCESMFVSYRGRKVGSIGDVGCFSTYVAHIVVAGIGGFATTDDDELATIMRSLMNHGRDTIYISIDDDKGLTGEDLRRVIAGRFSFQRVGYNFRVTELEAAIALGQLEKRNFILKRRREVASYLMEHLKDLEEYLQLPYVPDDREHAFMLFGMVLRGGDKWAFMDFLESNLIETRELFPLLSQPVYRRMFSVCESDFPVASWIGRGGLYIGCHQYLTDQELEYVVEKIHEFFKKRL